MSGPKLVPPGGRKLLFDERPITLAGWRLLNKRAEPLGTPTPAETEFAFEFASEAGESSGYWVGDICAYTESREDWNEKASQIISATGLARHTIENYASMARSVDQASRDLSPSVAHSKVVQKLAPAEQRKWLRTARTEGWGKRDLDRELKASQKRGVITGSADLVGLFRVWSIDCPWTYNQAQPSKMSAQTHYPGMTVKELIAMGPTVQAHTAKHAVGFFWVTAPMLYYATDPDKGPDPYRVIRSWGFTPKTGGVWDKVEHNFGNYLSIRHEHLIIATRGHCTPDRPTPMLDSIFTERKSDVHSKKPACVIAMIERLYDGPYCEMFAREQRAGWTCYGNQILREVAV